MNHNVEDDRKNKKMKNKKTMKNKNTVRRYLLIILCHADRRESVTKEMILLRIREIFECGAIVIAREAHQEGGYHYHVAVLTSNASKNNATKIIREAFSEWDGRAIDVKFHKTWPTAVSYTMKEDKEPTIWGEYSVEQLREICSKRGKHKRIESMHPQEIIDRLAGKKDILEIYEDEILKAKILTALPRMKEAHEDLKTIKMMRETVMERIQAYLKEKGNPPEYHIEELQEKYLLIDWVACQLCFRRPIKTKQLFLYGNPSTQKTLIFNLLQKVVNIYFVSSRRNDFTGANDHYDLWVFDEFHEPGENTGMFGATEEGTAYANTILRILDGQECRLDSKYARVFTKRRNIPVVMIANKLPQAVKNDGPFKARFIRLRFHSKIRNLKEERVIATLWGCMQRRIAQSPYALEGEILDEEVKLDYNECEGIIIPKIIEESKRMKTGEKIRKILQEKGEDIVELKAQRDQLEHNVLLFFTRQGQCIEMTTINIGKGKGEQMRHEKPQWTRLGILLLKEKRTSNIFMKKGNHIMSLIDFSIIPLRKRMKEEEEEAKAREGKEGGVDPFKKEREKEIPTTKIINKIEKEEISVTQIKLYRNKGTLGTFIYRSSNPLNEDYATWPLQLVAPKTQREIEEEQTYRGRRDESQIKRRTWELLIREGAEPRTEFHREVHDNWWEKVRGILKQIEENPEGEQLKIYRIEIALCGRLDSWTEDD